MLGSESFWDLLVLCIRTLPRDKAFHWRPMSHVIEPHKVRWCVSERTIWDHEKIWWLFTKLSSPSQISNASACLLLRSCFDRCCFDVVFYAVESNHQQDILRVPLDWKSYLLRRFDMKTNSKFDGVAKRCGLFAGWSFIESIDYFMRWSSCDFDWPFIGEKPSGKNCPMWMNWLIVARLE